MSSPSVSVLIPSYNYARYLPEAIDSVLNQSLRDFELVIRDDGSSDSSTEILAEYARGDERIRYRSNGSNLGMVENWNACLSAARGEYVKFLLADDRLTHSTALEQLVALLRAHPAARLAASAREIIDEKSRRVRIKGFAGRRRCVPGAEAIARCVGAGANLIGEPSCVLFRRADLLRGFDKRYRQLVDLEMWFHLLRGGDLVFTPACLCGFRRHDRQQSSLNRGSGVHQNELAELVGQYANSTGELEDPALLTAWSYRLRRLDPCAETQTVLEAIDTRLGAVRPLRHFVYALSRPVSNLGRRLRFQR